MILARIQAHPARSHLWGPLTDAIGLPTEVSVHESDPPSPWAGYKLCLSEIPDCSHLVVLQDDAQVCAHFAETVTRLALRNGDVPVSLFLAKAPLRIATAALRVVKRRGLYYDARFRINEFCPAVGMLWPVEKARQFLAWVEENPRKLGRPYPRSDDGTIGKWCAHTHQTVRFCLPSVVQHPGKEPSVKGAENAASRYTAMYFAEDGMAYEW